MPGYTYRPYVELSRTANIVGGGDSASVTSDNSDSTWVQLFNGGASYFLDGIGYATYASNEIIVKVRVNIRMRSTGGGGMNTYVYLENNVGQQCSPDYYPGNYSLTTFNGDWKNTAPDGGAWDFLKLSNLRVRVADNAAASTLPQVLEIYVDVITNYTPTASSVTPTTNQVTSRPTIGWTYADADGDTQAKFRVRVFSEAQYSASGFNPLTSTATVDSGDVYSSTSSWTVPVGSDLTNGTRYFAFVQVADGVTGVYSPLTIYGPYGAFNIVIAPPAVPEVYVTPDNVNKRNALTLQDRENIISATESDVEIALGGWTSDYNATVTRSTDYANNGTYSIKMTAITDSTGTYTSIRMSDYTEAAVLPGVKYSGVAYIYKNSGTARRIGMAIYWYDSSYNFLSQTTPVDITQRVGEWTPCFTSGVAPANAFVAKPVVFVYDLPTAEPHYVDTVSIVEFALNMLDNPIFEQDTNSDGIADNWQAYIFGPGPTPTYVIDKSQSGYNVAGVQAQKITYSGNIGNKGISSVRNIPVKTGLAYALSIWVMTDTAGAQVQFYHAGLNSGTALTANIPTAYTWTKVSFVTNSTSTTSASGLYISSTTAAQSLWIGQVQMEIGSANNNEVCNRYPWVRGGLVALQSFQVQRSYDQITWTDITNRLAYDPNTGLPATSISGLNVSDTLQSIIAYDYDVKLGVTAYYRVRNVATDNVTGNSLVSQWSMIRTVASTALTVDPLYWWVKVPNKPNLNIKIGFKGTSRDGSGWSRKSSETASFFSPISRPRKVKVKDAIYGDEFTLIASLISQSDIDAMASIRNAQQTILLQATDGRQWFVEMDNSVNFDEFVTSPTAPYQEVEIQFVEVDAPYV